MKKDRKVWLIGLVAALLLLAFAVMMYCEWRGSFSETVYACRKMLWAMPVFAVLIGLAHYSEAKDAGAKEYVKQVFCGKANSGGRKVYLDYARILAAVMVILTHACSMQVDEDAAPWRINLLLVCVGIGLVCNPLYVMLSGALLLGKEKEEPLGKFYFRRFVKVAVPMLVYYVIFLCLSGGISLIPPQNIKEGALLILAGASGIVPHYWLIYTLLSLYITAPFLRVMVRNLNDGQITALFYLILAQEVIATYCPLLGIQTGFIWNLAAWEGIFILGYIIANRRTKLIERTVLILGGISVIILSAVMILDYASKDYVCNKAPTMVLFAGAVLILLSKLEAKYKIKGKFDVLIQVLAKYSYAIILVHWCGLFVVTWGKIGLQPLRFGCIGGIALTVLVAFLVCFVLGFLADNTIVLVVQKGMEAIGKIPSEIKKSIGKKEN